jgi:hypothetical protein
MAVSFIFITILVATIYNHKAIESTAAYGSEVVEVLRNDVGYWIDENNYQLYLKSRKSQ